MKKIFIVCAMLLIASMCFADGSITLADNKVIEVKTEQSGNINVKCDEDTIEFTPVEREQFLAYLRAHLDAMNKFSSSSIKIKNTSSTASIRLTEVLQYRFVLITNESDDNYVMSLRLYQYNDLYKTYAFNIEKLNEYINLIDGTKTNTDDVKNQNAIVRNEIQKLRNLN